MRATVQHHSCPVARLAPCYVCLLLSTFWADPGISARGRWLRWQDTQPHENVEADVEAALWTSLLALGRAVMALFLARCAARPQAATYSHSGQRFARDGSNRRSTEIGTRFGKLPFCRPVGMPPGGTSRAADLPIDRELSLCSGFSLGTVTSVTRLCAMMAFATARAVFKQFRDWMPSQRAVLRMVDAIGAEARPGVAHCRSSTTHSRPSRYRQF